MVLNTIFWPLGKTWTIARLASDIRRNPPVDLRTQNIPTCSIGEEVADQAYHVTSHHSQRGTLDFLRGRASFAVVRTPDTISRFLTRGRVPWRRGRVVWHPLDQR